MSAELVALLIQFFILFLLLCANGFFVAVEFSYITVPRPRIDQLADKGDLRAQRVRRLLADTDRVLAISQLGITLASLGLGWVGENAVDALIRLTLGVSNNSWTHGIGLAIAFAAIAAFHTVLGEQAPKILAIRAADRFALLTARTVALIDFLMRPFVNLLDAATSAVVRLFGVQPIGAHKTIYSVEELMQLVSETQQHGELEPREKEMIHNLFEFSDKTVREVMTPRPQMVAVDEHSTVAAFLQTFRESSHARFPVYARNIDNVTGFVAIKDVLRALAVAHPDALTQLLGELTRPAIIVPESKRVGSLFEEMQAQKIQLAVVIDEFGGTAGMVTLEELIEEIVGRLSDELAQEPPSVETVDAQSSQVDAQLRVEEINELLNLQIPTSDEYETLAGFILFSLRRIPKEGEQFLAGNVRITITQMDGSKIERALITR